MALDDQVFEEILKYVDGALAPDEIDGVRDMIDSDPEAREMYETLSALRRESETMSWTNFRSAAKALTRRLMNDMARGGGMESDDRGVLTFDSSLLPLPAGVRPATMDGKRLHYQAGTHRIELSLSPSSSHSQELIGEISGFDTGEILKISLKRGPKKYATSTNRFQLFRFERVQSGTYALCITHESGRTVSVDIEI